MLTWLSTLISVMLLAASSAAAIETKAPANVLATTTETQVVRTAAAVATVHQVTTVPAPPPAPAAAPAADPELVALEDEAIRLTNLERVKAGLVPLVKSPTLTQIARAHNEDMIRHNFVAHQGSDGRSSAQRAQAAGYAPYGWGRCYVGENIAAGLHTPADAVNGWLGSPAHKGNLLRPEYREIGIGVAKGGKYGTYWTQNFGSAPNVFPVLVNHGATTVSSPRVTLNLTRELVSESGSMGAATQIMISHDPSFAGAAWQPFAGNVDWELAPGSGHRTVYVALRDAAGRIAVSRADVYLAAAPPAA